MIIAFSIKPVTYSCLTFSTDD